MCHHRLGAWRLRPARPLGGGAVGRPVTLCGRLTHRVYRPGSAPLAGCVGGPRTSPPGRALSAPGLVDGTGPFVSGQLSGVDADGSFTRCQLPRLAGRLVVTLATIVWVQDSALGVITLERDRCPTRGPRKRLGEPPAVNRFGEGSSPSRGAFPTGANSTPQSSLRKTPGESYPGVFCFPLVPQGLAPTTETAVPSV